MNTPICDFVRRYAEGDPLRFHMPGHKGRGPLGAERLDITEIPGADALYEAEGRPYGVCVYDEARGVAVGTKYVAYIPGETYYLFFNANSPHLGAWNGSADDAAIAAAGAFLALP